MFISSLYDPLIIILKLLIGWFGQQVAYYTVLSARAVRSWEGSAVIFVRISDVQWCYSMTASVAFVIFFVVTIKYKCIHTSGTFSGLWNVGKLKMNIMSLKTISWLKYLNLFLKTIRVLQKDSWIPHLPFLSHFIIKEAKNTTNAIAILQTSVEMPITNEL